VLYPLSYEGQGAVCTARIDGNSAGLGSADGVHDVHPVHLDVPDRRVGPDIP
jgi:hypothetical protein